MSYGEKQLGGLAPVPLLAQCQRALVAPFQRQQKSFPAD